MRKIALLGSTGSIGTQTVEVALANPEQIQIKALVAHVNDKLLQEQIELLQPELAVLTNPDAALRLKSRYRGNTVIMSGEEGLLAAATCPDTDLVLTAMVGYAGLRPTLAAIGCGKDIALANKETLVAAGELVVAAAQKNNVKLLPVDSEHSAIFQSLAGGSHSEVKRLLLTASGGPFLGRTKAELAEVTLSQCLKHPNWSMGKKVTVDSSTLANKGLEIIEAHWLFDMPYDKIEVVVHPQSIVHSMVEYIDGSVIAQLGLPDMRLPIQYALSYPQHFAQAFGQLDFVKVGQLTFFAPDKEAFPSLQLAIDAAKEGGIMPCVFNAANEIAVEAFLQEKIRYLDIPYIIAAVIDGHVNAFNPDVDMIAATDAAARAEAKAVLQKLMC